MFFYTIATILIQESIRQLGAGYVFGYVAGVSAVKEMEK